jgi:NAD(P) transhydrogenase subunit alpha
VRIAIPKEVVAGETRVAVIPQMITALTRDKHEVIVEKGAGLGASFSDEEYREAGATIAENPRALYEGAQVILKVQPPSSMHPSANCPEADLFPAGATYVGFLAPLDRPDVVKAFLARKISGFSVEYIPRITRAQSMDVLSAMSTVTGYKAVLLASNHMRKMIPLLMTAAGTIPPATVLILGAGVAGLQAVATAKRLGAKVEAFDPRPAVKEQVKSLGASFVEMEVPSDVETAGGYAKEQSEEFLRKEREAIEARLPKVDAVISTAQIFGKRAPVLITDAMVRRMRSGSVIVDLAAEQGGNCELTKAGETVERHGVTIIGPVNLAASLPIDASRMYSKNITTLFKLLFPKADSTPDFADEVIAKSCITRGGEIMNDQIKSVMK